MQIGWIELLEFRNYRTLRYTPAPRLNVLTGANGQGKTNLLEALAFLLTGRSFRTARLAELPRWGTSVSRLAGEIGRAEGRRAVQRVLEATAHGTWQGAGERCPWARVVVFGWQDLAVLHGMPAARRNFIDGVAARLYPTHAATFVRYRDVLTRRNALLRQRPVPSDLAARLAPWDEQLASTGMELIGRRRRATAVLQTELARIFPALSGERQKVEIRYRTELGEATEPATLVALLERRRADEVRRAQTLAGPHRDDLAIELDGVDARVYGSRGQQRLLALSLRLAEVLPLTEAVGTAPVLLLDDALSELDGRVRDHVLREITTAEQVFLTSPDPLPGVDAARWKIDAGEVSAA